MQPMKCVLTPEQERAYMLVFECFGSTSLITLHFMKFLIEKKQGLVWEGEIPNLMDEAAGDAQIVLSLLPNGRLLLKAYRFGRWNTTYANGDDSVMAEIPALVQELRSEVAAIKAGTFKGSK